MEVLEVLVLLFVWVMAFMKGCIAGWIGYDYISKRNEEFQKKIDERVDKLHE
jgi:predicted DNA-binding transcriptional regulator